MKKRSNNEKRQTESKVEIDRDRRREGAGKKSGRAAREAGVKNMTAPAVPISIKHTSRSVPCLFDQLI